MAIMIRKFIDFLKGDFKMELGLVLLIVGVFLVALIFIGYNKLIALIKTVDNTKAQIDVTLDERGKKFDSLASVVKSVMSHEMELITEVTKLRSKSETASTEKERFGIEEALSGVASKLNLVMEAYPEIKSNQNALQLQDEIANIESKLAYAKQGYNSSITTYETARDSIPWMFVAMIIPAVNKKFTLWQVDDEKRENLEDQRVSL